MIEIRPERPEDRRAVRRVNEAAFGRPDEAELVDRLRARAASYLGLVATGAGAVVGHIAFSPVTLEPAGAGLVRAGLAACRAAGAQAVLGHPDYYPRFGFAPTAARGITSAYDAPPEAFMLIELQPGALDGTTGTVRYDPALTG